MATNEADFDDSSIGSGFSSEEPTLSVYRDRAVLVRDDEAFRNFKNKKHSALFAITSRRSEDLYNITCKARYDQEELTPFIIEKHEDIGPFKRKDDIWEMLDCGLLGRNWSRKQLLPFYKIKGSEMYICADAHEIFSFE